MRKPTFLHIGPPRCGTTWMWKSICEHPEVWEPYKKEIRYFNTKKLAKGKRWYFGKFNPKEKHKAWGEATPHYLSDMSYDGSQTVAELVTELIPECDLICCLRDPVDRAYSHWKMLGSWSNIDMTFDEAVRRDVHGIASRGLYWSHLSEWFRYYERSDILVQEYQEVLNNNLASVRAVYRHIGASENFKPDKAGKSYNKELLPNTKKYVERVLGRRILEKLTNSKFAHIVRRFEKIKSKYENKENKIKNKTTKYLNDYYKKSNRKIKKELQIDISNWRG